MSLKTVDENQIQQALSADVYDNKGQQVKFSSILQGKTIVVFIRHFFCGTCRMYVEQLVAVRSEALEAASTKIVLVGCGDWKMIDMYKEKSGFTGPIYSNPSRDIYQKLGMMENLERAAKPPKYLTTSRLHNSLASTWDTLRHFNWFGSQGKLSQLGGELIFDSERVCIFSHIMVNTEDHTEVEDLFRAASVEFP